MIKDYHHTSVLIEESIQGLAIKPDGFYLDGTIGGAGHSSQILKQLNNGLLIGIDKDSVALEVSNERLKAIGQNFVLAHMNFKHFDVLLDQLEIEKIDGAILDLGVSSHQIDSQERGFSFLKDAKLDMRMDQQQNLDADFVVNHYSQEQLEKLIREYGQERYAKAIAKRIVQQRPLHSTLELAELVKSCVPYSPKEKKHPATRTFQAIRIEVNDELKGLAETLVRLTQRIKSGGRLAVISFHSLEDSIVKQVFRDLEQACSCPEEFPICVCDTKKRVRSIQRKAITAQEDEIATNPRSRSAKLRIVEVL